MHGSQDAAQNPTTTMIVQCLRVGSPPYRFGGRSVARAEAVGAHPRDALFVELWKRNKGGYTLSFSCWTPRGVQADAFNARTVSEAVTQLENLCTANVEAVKNSYCSNPEALFLEVEGLARHQSWIDAFQTLVARALDEWSDPENRAFCVDI